MTAPGPTLRLARRIRTGLWPCALVLALCQVGLVAASSVTMAARPSHATVSADEVCTCDHTTGVMCPMHRRPSTRPVPANTPRWRTGCDESAYVLAPVFGALGAPELLQHAPRPEADARTRSVVVGRTLRLDRPPDNPPPRV